MSTRNATSTGRATRLKTAMIKTMRNNIPCIPSRTGPWTPDVRSPRSIARRTSSEAVSKRLCSLAPVRRRVESGALRKSQTTCGRTSNSLAATVCRLSTRNAVSESLLNESCTQTANYDDERQPPVDERKRRHQTPPPQHQQRCAWSRTRTAPDVFQESVETIFTSLAGFSRRKNG